MSTRRVQTITLEQNYADNNDAQNIITDKGTDVRRTVTNRPWTVIVINFVRHYYNRRRRCL